MHAAADGSEPFGLSIPVRALLARNDPELLLEELVKAVESRLVSLQACWSAKSTEGRRGIIIQGSSLSCYFLLLVRR